MADPILAGTLGAISKPFRITYDPVRGLSVHGDWECGGSDSVVGYINDFIRTRQAFDAEISPRKSRIVATFTQGANGFGGDAQNHWQLQQNEIQEDIKLHPAFVSLGDTEMDKILKQADSKIADRSFTADMTGISTLGQEFYFIMTHGYTHYAFSQYAFHWTTYVPFNSTGFRGEGGRESIFTTSQVLSIADPPSGIADEMASIPSPFIPSNFIWGWRRVGSTRTTQAGNRIEIATEFWLALYPTCVYSPA